MHTAQVHPDWKVTAWNKAAQLVQSFIPVNKRPEESKISYLAREAFLLLSKFTCACAVIYGVSLLAAGGIPGLMVITAIFLSVFSFDKRVSPFAKVMINALALVMGKVGLHSMGTHIVIQLAASMGLAVVSLFFAANKRSHDRMEIKGTKESILEELQKLNREYRAVKHLVLDCEDVDLQILSTAKDLESQEITFLNGCPSSSKVEQLNESLHSKPNNRRKFYYQSNALDEDYKLTLAITKPDELLVGAFPARMNFIKKFNCARNKEEVQRVMFETWGNNFEEELVFILNNLQPKVIQFPGVVEAQVLQLLNLPRGDWASYNHYYYQFEFRAGWCAVKKLIQNGNEYQAGIGQTLTKENVLECLNTLHPGCQLKKLTIKQAEMQKTFEVPSEIIKILAIRKPSKIILEGASISEKMLGELNNELEYKAFAVRHEIQYEPMVYCLEIKDGRKMTYCLTKRG